MESNVCECVASEFWQRHISNKGTKKIKEIFSSFLSHACLPTLLLSLSLVSLQREFLLVFFSNNNISRVILISAIFLVKIHLPISFLLFFEVDSEIHHAHALDQRNLSFSESWPQICYPFHLLIKYTYFRPVILFVSFTLFVLL